MTGINYPIELDTKHLAKHLPNTPQMKRLLKNYLLLLLVNNEGKCHIYDPAKNYQVIFSSNDYETAKLWLLEDEYEPIEGRLSLDELLV